MNKEPPAHKQLDPKKYPGQIFTRPEYNDQLLKDYITRKQESDSFFDKKEEKK